MDFATLFGILAGFGLVIGAIFMGGDPGKFVDVPSVMIVVGGTLSSTLVNFPLEEVLHAIKGAWRAFVGKKASEQARNVVDTMVRIAEISRRDGIMALENIQTDNPVLKKACQLIADNANAYIIHDVLNIEIAAIKRRHNIPIAVFSKLGAYAPAFGMVGTLIGLVQMLSNLSDPEAIGPGMAVAILTTFYGASLSFLLFIPISGKLKARSMQDEVTLMIIFEGARCILENNNPRLVYEKLSSFIPIKERKSG